MKICAEHKYAEVSQRITGRIQIFNVEYSCFVQNKVHIKEVILLNSLLINDHVRLKLSLR